MLPPACFDGLPRVLYAIPLGKVPMRKLPTMVENECMAKTKHARCIGTVGGKRCVNSAPAYGCMCQPCRSVLMSAPKSADQALLRLESEITHALRGTLLRGR